jgi:IstB-like ATP binding protein
VPGSCRPPHEGSVGEEVGEFRAGAARAAQPDPPRRPTASVFDAGQARPNHGRGAVAARDERSAIAIASYEPFSVWTSTFTDPRLCAAIVDRLTFAGQIIEAGTTTR